MLLGASPFYLPPGVPLAEGTGEMDRERLVRCRLTALGLESRDEIYTLFVATRILNFLRGLPLEAGAEVSLGETLEVARGLGGETLWGSSSSTGSWGRASSTPPQGLEPLPRFRTGLFRSLWEKLDCVATQTGATIRIGAVQGCASAAASRSPPPPSPVG